MSTEQMKELGLPFATGLAAQQSLPIDEAMAYAAEHGCSRFYIEGAYRADCSDSWDEARVAKYRGLIRDSGLRPIFHGNYKLPLGHEDEAVREAAVRSVMREVDIVAGLGGAELGAALIVHGSCIFTHKKPAQARLEAIDSFTRSAAALQAYAAPRGVEIWLENLENYKDRHPFHTIYSQRSEYEYVLQRVPGVRFILDVGHENVGGDPVGVFEAMSDRIVALDVNDNRGEYDTHWGLGKGSVDFAALTRVIAEKKWSGHITVETRGSAFAHDVKFLAGAYARAAQAASASTP